MLICAQTILSDMMRVGEQGLCPYESSLITNHGRPGVISI